MDRKAIIVITSSIVLLFFWPIVFQKLYPAKPLPSGGTNVLAAAVLATNVAGATPVAPTAAASTATLPAVVAPVQKPSAAEELIVVSNSVARYTFTSWGGGIRSVELYGYPQTVDCGVGRKKEDVGKGPLASLNTDAQVAALSLVGDSSLTGDGVYTLVRTATGVQAQKVLPNGLTAVKDFEIGSNYVFRARVRLENRSGQSVLVPSHEFVVGTATPREVVYDVSKVGFYWGQGTGVQHVTPSWFANLTLGCFPGTPRSVYQDGSSNVTWAAVHNQFFAMAVIPRDPAYQVIGRELALPPPTPEQLAEHPSANRKPVGYETGLIYPSITIPAAQALEREFSVYAGPKEYNTLARLGAQFKFDLDRIMGFDQVLFGSFSGFFAKLLLLALNGIHALGLPYGVTIVVITVLIKLLFWPLTQASTRSMKRMQELQPQMKALQDRYKDDPAKLNKKMMEFWKEHKVNPFGGCLPILLQMPVFIGFFAMIQTAIELRGAEFLWACDLTKPDTLFLIPGLGMPFNLMPLLMGGTMLWQARLQPAAPGMDPMQARMMKYMPLMFLFMLYNFSSGLTLYWTVQNLLSILQMKLTRSADAAAGPKKSAAKA